MLVKYNSIISDWFIPKNGVKQGGVLSPTLFFVYMDGVIERLEKAGVGCHVGRKFCGILSYAEDIMLLAPTQGATKKMLRVCGGYASQVKVEYNGNKSIAIVLDKFKSDSVPSFAINGEEIECVSEILYLGYTIMIRMLHQ